VTAFFFFSLTLYSHYQDELETQQREALDEMSNTWPEYCFTRRVTTRELRTLERAFGHETPIAILERGRGFSKDGSSAVSLVERDAIVRAMQDTVILGYPIACWSKRTGLSPSPFKRVYAMLCKQLPNHRLTVAVAKRIYMEVRANMGGRAIEKTTGVRTESDRQSR
jgi:hypothetical protein